MRAFGIGLFLAGASLAAYEQVAPTPEAKEQKDFDERIEQYEAKIAELEQQLKDKPTVTENETEADSEDTKQVGEKTTEPTSYEEKPSEDIVTATIYIYENVSIYAIGQQVEDEGIISNGRELELYLSKPEYARSIQKGAFDLRSDMTIEQIAKTLTGKKISE